MRNVVFGLALFAVGLGCSGSDDNGNPVVTDSGDSADSADSGTDSVAETPAITADQACGELSDALCARVEACAPLFIPATYGTGADCRARAKLDCMSGANAPGTGGTAADISACASAAKAAPCADLLNNKPPAACAPRPGAVADGAACGSDSQCKSGFCGLNQEREVCGVCAPAPAAGQPCVRARCPQGLVCSADFTTCGAPVAIGSACDAKSACLFGSQCFGGKCVAHVATEGAACDDKAGPNCDFTRGLSCLSNKCMKLTLVAAGENCGLKVEGMAVTGLELCEKGGWCKGLDPGASPPKFNGVCEAAAADGQACVADATINKGPGCLEPAECVAGKCTLPDATTCK